MTPRLPRIAVVGFRAFADKVASSAAAELIAPLNDDTRPIGWVSVDYVLDNRNPHACRTGWRASFINRSGLRESFFSTDYTSAWRYALTH